MPTDCIHSPNSSTDSLPGVDCIAVDSASSSTLIPSHRSNFVLTVAGIVVGIVVAVVSAAAAAVVVVATVSVVPVVVAAAAIDGVAAVVEEWKKTMELSTEILRTTEVETDFELDSE